MEESGEHSRRRRRPRRRRRAAARSMEEGPVWRDPITQEEFRFRASESGLSRRPGRSGTRFEASASAALPVLREYGGTADPDPPARLQPLRGHGFVLPVLPDPEYGDFPGYALTQGRRGPGMHSQASSSSAAPPSDRPGAEGRPRVRQSVLYSDRPRHSRLRRLARAEEHAIVPSISELGSPVMHLPTFEALSLSDPPLSIPETAKEIYDDCDEMPGDVGQSVPSPKGLYVKIVSFEKKPKPDVDIEEELRLFKEYQAARPKNFWQAIAEVKANERLTLAALAAKSHTKRPREVPQQPSFVAAHPQLNMSQRARRHEASEETFRTGNEWMNEEVMLCFKKYVERRSPYLKGLVDYELGEIQHQCFNVESYNKVYHHYNFTVRMKMQNSDDWTVQLYFGEAKEIFMRKYYGCYLLEPNENGCCYACKSQGAEALRHPAFDVFEMGSRDSSACDLWYTDE